MQEDFLCNKKLPDQTSRCAPTLRPSGTILYGPFLFFYTASIMGNTGELLLRQERITDTFLDKKLCPKPRDLFCW